MKKYLLIIGIVSLPTLLVAQNNYNEISLAQLMNKRQGGNKDMIILDVRSKGEYHDTSQFRHLNIGRIKGAINIPIADLQQKPEAIKLLEDAKDKEIFVICSHSYRSRTVSNLLLRNNFTKVTNVRGGMSEWFRNYDELQPFMAANYEKSIAYHNISPSELLKKIDNKEDITFFAFRNPPKTSFDTLVLDYVLHLPEIKNTEFFTAKDSAAVLQKAKSLKGKTIVTYNLMGTGGGEMANWLAQNGVDNVHYLIGNFSGFFEYLVNYKYNAKTEKFLKATNKLNFYSPMSLCRGLESGKKIQLIDLRADSLFSKTTNGTKLSYKHIRGAINFPFDLPAEEFEKKFTDKSKEYVLLPHLNYSGISLANALLAKGYKIGWLMAGNERWEWYSNNIEDFKCKDHFVL